MLDENVLINIFLVHIFLFFFLLLNILWKCKQIPKNELFFQDSSVMIHETIKRCRSMERYIPMYLWGKSGHIQSIVHSIFGRIGTIPISPSTRHAVVAKDGSVVSYDIVEASTKVQKKDDMIVIVPGICSHAESTYIKAFSTYMAKCGYMVAVFNHTGALKTIQLQKPRIFNYGQTDDLDLVIQTLLKETGYKKFIGIGFSLGGNILMKYLGEKRDRQTYFHFAASICQGYDIPECCKLMEGKDNLRFVYNYGLTRKMLDLILHHKETFNKHNETNEHQFDWKKISSSKSLHQLDINFTIKMTRENDVGSFYRNSSSSKYIDNIRIPMLILNTKDDPLIPEQLFKYPKKLIDSNPNVLFLVTEYGGHLGFFEGGYIIPNHLTWMDRMLGEYIDVTRDILREHDTT